MHSIILIILVILLISAIPRWGYNRAWAAQPWGYYPAGGLGLIFVILLILFILGRL